MNQTPCITDISRVDDPTLPIPAAEEEREVALADLQVLFDRMGETRRWCAAMEKRSADYMDGTASDQFGDLCDEMAALQDRISDAIGIVQLSGVGDW